MSKIIGKNIKVKVQDVSTVKKILDHAKKFSLNELKTASKRVIQKTAQVAGDLVGTENRRCRISKNNRNTKRKTHITRRKIANY